MTRLTNNKSDGAPPYQAPPIPTPMNIPEVVVDPAGPVVEDAVERQDDEPYYIEMVGLLIFLVSMSLFSLLWVQHALALLVVRI